MTKIDINEIMKDRVTLDIECIAPFYLNGYVPNLQTGGHLVRFLVLCEELRGYSFYSLNGS